MSVEPELTVTLSRADMLSVLALIYAALKPVPELAAFKQLSDVADRLEVICYPVTRPNNS
jgi:hypothetical protein